MQHVADRYPATIIGQGRAQTFLVQRDRAVPDPSFPAMSNRWLIYRDTDGPIYEFTLRRDGSYRAKGSKYPVLTKGWSHYYSYEF